MTQKFKRAVPVRNSPHFGTDYVYSDDQRSGKDRRAHTHSAPPALTGETDEPK